VLSQASSGAVIYIAPGTYNEYLHLYDMAVDLEGAGLTTILNGGIVHPVDGGVIDSLCTALDHNNCLNTLTITNLTIRNGWAEDGGGGVYVRFTPLIMKNVMLLSNRSSSGGGLYIDSSTASLDNVIVLNNATNNEYQNGSYGGAGIYNNMGTLSMANSTISSNSAIQDGGGIYNNGLADLTNVVIAGNSAGSSVSDGDGGGIKNAGTAVVHSILNLTNSTVRDNHAIHGGGLSNDHAQANITGTTINDNTSAIAGGGILNTNSGIVELINTTISGNKGGNEGGGIASTQGSILNMTNDTIAANQATHTGGLVYQSGSIYLLNVLLDGNSGGNCGSTLIGGSYIISSDASCSFEGEFFNNGVVAKIGPLQDNGGPTETHALLAGSPAIDAGTSALSPNVDQRGVLRPRDGNNDGIADYDIGAFEYGLIMPSGIQPNALVTATPGPGKFTFQEAWNCFSGPGPEYGLLAQGAAGETAPVNGRTADGTWYHVKLPADILCWVSGNLGTYDGNPFGLPVLPFTPAPTLTSTATLTPTDTLAPTVTLAPPATFAPIATFTRILLPTRPKIPSRTPTRAPAPTLACTGFKNKTDCESHPECTWFFGLAGNACRNK
jgi:hypothetical protein